MWIDLCEKRNAVINWPHGWPNGHLFTPGEGELLLFTKDISIRVRRHAFKDGARNYKIGKYRPINEMWGIMQEDAGMHPAQFTCLICRLCQLYEKYTSKY